jgi:hypothetical protein
MFCVVSLDHLIRIPPFGLWGEVGGHLKDCHRQQKRGGNFWFLSPSFAFMDYILHMLIHIRKQGETLNMPIAAIENTKLFGGHWIRHCFRPLVCLFIRVFANNGNSPTWTRTRNPRVNSSVLCQLSYKGMKIMVV